MLKEAPHQSPSPAAEKDPAKEGWILRNRGGLVLALGLAFGCSAKITPSSATSAEPTVQSSDIMSASAAAPSAKVRSPLSDEASLPSLCELREGTPFEVSPALDQFCEGDPISQEAGCKSLKEWGKALTDSQIRMIAKINLARAEMAEKKPGISFSEYIIEDFQKFESLPDTYKKELKIFDPTLYASLKDRLFIEKTAPIGQEWASAAATANGPFNLENGRLVPSRDGQYYAVTVAQIPTINVDEALRSNDRFGIFGFLQYSNLFAHEIYGHIAASDKRLVMPKPKFPKFDEMCSKDIPDGVKDELYAYFTGAKMLASMAARYPKISEILNQTYADRAKLRTVMKTRVICRNEEVEGIGKEFNAQLQLDELAGHYHFYQQAIKTGDWQPFKDLIVTETLFKQFGLPYLLAGLKKKGKENCAAALNGELETIMSKDSPDKFFEKK